MNTVSSTYYILLGYIEKQIEINNLTREREGKLLYTVSSRYYIWLCFIVTDKVLVENQEEYEKLMQKKESML